MKRIDSNHRLIVRALRDVGVTVLSLADLGKGAPDIACGWRGLNYFFEIKDGSLPPSRRKLTPDEEQFHATWRGQVAVIESVDEALKAIGAI